MLFEPWVNLIFFVNLNLSHISLHSSQPSKISSYLPIISASLMCSAVHDSVINIMSSAVFIMYSTSNFSSSTFLTMLLAFSRIQCMGIMFVLTVLVLSLSSAVTLFARLMLITMSANFYKTPGRFCIFNTCQVNNSDF